MPKAAVIASVVRGDGHRGIAVVGVGDSEDETLWSEFPRDLTGMHLVIIPGPESRRRNHPGDAGPPLATLPRPRHAQPAHRRPPQALLSHRRTQLHRVRPVRPRPRTRQTQRHRQPTEPLAPEAARLLADMANGLLAQTEAPTVHWPKIWSINAIERLNRAIK